MKNDEEKSMTLEVKQALHDAILELQDTERKNGATPEGLRAIADAASTFFMFS